MCFAPARSDQFCVIRTVNHPQNDHNGTHYIQTGHPLPPAQRGADNVDATDKDWPAIGSVVEYLAQQSPEITARPLPSYAVVPNSLGRLQEAGQYRRPGEHAGWLGRRYNPPTTSVDKRDLKDNPYFRDCNAPPLADDRAAHAEGLGCAGGGRGSQA